MSLFVLIPFPGHTTASFAVGISYALSFPGCFLRVLWAALVGWSRVYVGVHYPSDVLWQYGRCRLCLYLSPHCSGICLTYRLAVVWSTL